MNRIITNTLRVQKTDVLSLLLDSDSESSYSDEDKSEIIQKQVEELKKQLQDKPKDKEGYDKIIELYRSLGEIDDLRAIRLQYKQNYPLSPGFIDIHFFTSRNLDSMDL